VLWEEAIANVSCIRLAPVALNARGPNRHGLRSEREGLGCPACTPGAPGVAASACRAWDPAEPGLIRPDPSIQAQGLHVNPASGQPGRLVVACLPLGRITSPLERRIGHVPPTASCAQEAGGPMTWDARRKGSPISSTGISAASRDLGIGRRC
jgi:hypothetical protein